MKLSTLISIGVAATLLMTVALYTVVDAETLVTFESLFYLGVISGLIILIVNRDRSPSYPLLILLCMYVYQKYVLSGLYVLLSGASLLSSNLSIFTRDNYSHYLGYAVFGLSAAALGLILGGAAKSGKAGRDLGPVSDRFVLLIKPRRMLVYSLLLIASTIYLQYFLGVSNPHYDDSHWTAFRIFMRGTVPRNFLILMLFYAWDRYSKSEKKLTVASVLVSLFGAMILGSSRAGLYYLALLFFILKLMDTGNFTVQLRHVKYFCFAVLLSVAIYPTVTAIRWASYNKDFYSSPDLDRITEQSSVFRTNTDVAISVLERLTCLREALIVSNNMHVADPGDLMSFTSMLKRLVPWVVKDMFFGNALDVMPAQYVYDHIFEGRFIGFNAQEWGFWEYFAIAEGPYLGLGVVFAYMFAAGFLWRRTRERRSPFQPFMLLTAGYFFTMFLLNYDPAYVIYSFAVELIVLFSVLPFVSSFAIYFQKKGRAA